MDNTKKLYLHRSISQLIHNMDDMSANELGRVNPAMSVSNEDTLTLSTIQMDTLEVSHQHENTTNLGGEPTTSHNDSGCFNIDPLSPDSEYDEGLAFPDSVTILSISDNPVLVQRKEDDISEFIINDNKDINYLAIYNPPIKFTSLQRKVFIPRIEINVKIIDNERSITTHLLNPNLYTIELTHGPFVWIIKKRYKHFTALHHQLRLFRTSLHIPFPTRSHKERRASFRNKNDIAKDIENGDKPKKKKRKGALPRFPNRPEALVPVESLNERIKQLEEYLYNLLNISLYRNHPDTVDFLEVSNLSFITALGEKGKEGPIKKRTGSTRPGQAGCNFCGFLQNGCCVRCNYFCSDVVCGKWRNRWFFVKESCFGYMRPKDGTIRCIVLFDQGFEVSTGIYSTGMRNGLQLITNNRQIILKCWTKRKAVEWLKHLKMVATVEAKDFTAPNPYNSFVPQRSGIKAGWFVDGAIYMSAVADALEGATEEIFIADWWLSPEIYMKRPTLDGDYWRLDKILQRKANQGVKVFVLLYKEVELALGINSYYSKQKLVEQHENIKVIRHPDHARVGVFFWAHHEKIVVIDQTYAFLGGIDLCYGRWDDYKHRLTDLGSISTPSSNNLSGQDAIGNAYKTDPSAIKTKQKRHLSDPLPILQPGDKLFLPRAEMEPCPENTKRNTPEMERKNMLEKFKDNMKTKGQHFMHRITSNEPDDGTDYTAEVTVDGRKSHDVIDKNLVFCSDELRDSKLGDFENPLPKQNEMLTKLDGQAKYWMGKDYTNFIIKDFTNLESPYIDLVDRSTTPRMPWHDIGCVVYGKPARDVARHFIQRWNAVKLEKARDNATYPYIAPKSYNNIKIDDKFLSHPLQTVSCQVLRSVSAWSCGFIEPDLVEQSIHDAYIQTITSAQHYIYIENQFFITLEMGNAAVHNQIAETLYKRILRANREKKTFRVYVIMPLLPGFEGDVGGNTGNAMRAITHWNYASISRGKTSILARLKLAGIKDPSEYISFHSLRKHDVLNNNPVTELIYVHSKLLIADDKIVICGSANINDRSLIGKRDSEIAVIITDEEFIDGKMNGSIYPCGLFAGKLRKFLFKEHLGLIDPDPNRIPIDIKDPTIDTFWNGMWQRTSQRNTKIFDEIFKCIPTDEVQTFVGLKKYLEEPAIYKTNVPQAFKEIERIQGNLVDLPLQFLSQEILTPPGTSREGIIPTAVWT